MLSCIKKSLFNKCGMVKSYFTQPGMFSRLLVIFCIAYCVRITEWGMDQFEQSNTEAGTLITASLTLFGGELLLLLLKRVFGNIDFKFGRNKTNKVEAESNIDSVG